MIIGGALVIGIIGFNPDISVSHRFINHSPDQVVIIPPDELPERVQEYGPETIILTSPDPEQDLTHIHLPRSSCPDQYNPTPWLSPAKGTVAYACTSATYQRAFVSRKLSAA